MPRVSVIVPCFNEEATIYPLLAAVYHQTYAHEDVEVIIADGLSQDATLDRIAEFRNDHTDMEVRVVVNEARTIPSGLNCAIRAAKGEFLIRLDAHSRPYPDYIARCLADLEAGRGDNVGGIWEIIPGNHTWIARSIARASSHPLGVGDARYRIGTRASEVDTVPFGAFRRSTIDRIGLYDERLHSNEDYEFNARLRQSGGRIWLDPDIVSVYHARANLPELFRQYWRYGFWKFRMLVRYPRTLRWRQSLPPLLVLSLCVLLLLAWWPLARMLLTLELGLYFFALFLAGVSSALRQRDFAFVGGIPLAIATMHFAWGAGFLVSGITSLSGNPSNG